MNSLYINIFLLFIAVIIGGFLPFYIKNILNNKIISLLLTFSGSFLLSITLIHLTPSIEYNNNYNNNYLILLGFFMQLTLEHFSHGIEHGHLYTKKNINPVSLLMSLSLHAFFESIPIYYFNKSLIMGIALHHIPAAFALSNLLIYNKYKNSFIISNILVFAIMAPIGMLLGKILENHIMMYNKFILPIIIGMFLYISTTILLESNTSHKLKYDKILAIILGFICSLI